MGLKLFCLRVDVGEEGGFVLEGARRSAEGDAGNGERG